MPSVQLYNIALWASTGRVCPSVVVAAVAAVGASLLVESLEEFSSSLESELVSDKRSESNVCCSDVDSSSVEELEERVSSGSVEVVYNWELFPHAVNKNMEDRISSVRCFTLIISLLSIKNINKIYCNFFL